MALQKLGTGTGHLKAGLFGMAGSGKTYTAVELAIGTRELLGLEGPIAMFDTEGGSEYIAHRVRKAGTELYGVRAQSLGQLMQCANECIEAGVSVLIVDSITHCWRELMDTYRRRTGRSQLSFPDWANIKREFQQWTDRYLAMPLSCIVCGRAGYEYDMEDKGDGKREMVKSGTKMKAEGEFGFEPSLLIEMEVLKDRSGGRNTGSIVNRATIVKDRFDVINGRQFDRPTFESFRPHVELLNPGAHAAVDTDTETEIDLDDDGTAQWRADKRNRDIAVEKLKAAMLLRWPSQSADDKRNKAIALEAFAGTSSWTEVENMPADRVTQALEDLVDAHPLEET